MSINLNNPSPNAPAAVVTPAPAPKSRRRKILTWLIAIAALPLGLQILQAIRVAVAWNEFCQSQEELRRRWDESPTAREPWLDPPTPGNAWDGYLAVAARIRQLPRTDWDAVMNESVLKTTPLDILQVTRLLKREQILFDVLREAASRAEVRIPIDWTRSHVNIVDPIYDDIKQLRVLARLLQVTIRRKAAEGDWSGAVNDITLGLQVGCDLTRRAPSVLYLMGKAIIGIVLEAGKGLLETPGMPASEALRFATALERCERELPSLDRVLEWERLATGSSLRMLATNRMKELDADQIAGVRANEWRSGFSLRIAARDVDAEWKKFVSEARENSGLAYEQTHSAHATWFSRSLGGPSRRTLFKVFFFDFIEMENMWRLGTAQLRLARLAALARAMAPPVSLKDPWTQQPLRREDTSSEIRFWSEGINGSQGGEGDWWGGLRESRGRDTVLTIEK